jgi:hypothetical protein
MNPLTVQHCAYKIKCQPSEEISGVMLIGIGDYKWSKSEAMYLNVAKATRLRDWLDAWIKEQKEAKP